MMVLRSLWLLEAATSTEYVSLMVLSSITMYNVLSWTVRSVGFVVDKMTLGEVVFRVVELSVANIAPLIVHTHLHSQSSPSQKSNLAKLCVLRTKSGNRVQ